MMSDKNPPPKLAAIPTASDKMAAEFETLARLYRLMRENADEIAATRRALFKAYVKAGFTEPEAMALVSGNLAI